MRSRWTRWKVMFFSGTIRSNTLWVRFITTLPLAFHLFYVLSYLFLNNKLFSSYFCIKFALFAHLFALWSQTLLRTFVNFLFVQFSSDLIVRSWLWRLGSWDGAVMIYLMCRVCGVTWRLTFSYPILFTWLLFNYGSRHWNIWF